MTTSVAKIKAVLTAALNTMPDAFLDCRDYGHSWAAWTVKELRNGWEQRLRCTRCHTVRTRTLNRRGTQVKASYTYDGYLISGIGRLTGTDRDALRLAHLERLLSSNPDLLSEEVESDA